MNKNMQCVSNMLKCYSIEDYKMQNSSPDTDPTGSSILYNDSGYFTNHNPDPQSYSSNSNSEPSFEVVEEISLHSRHGECLPTLQSTSGTYFCEDAVFDEPRLEGPPLLCNNTNNYEQFSSLIKFSLEKASGSYLNDANFLDSNNSEYYNNIQTTNVLQYFDQDSLSSFSSINPSQPICVSEVENRQNIVSQAVEQCLTISASQNKSDIEVKLQNASSSRRQQLVNNNNCTITSEFINVNRTPTKSYINPVNSDLSPELFSEDELVPDIEISLTNVLHSQRHSLPNEQLLKNDQKLLKRVQETLNGVPPPPSLTILQLSVSEMLETINNNKELFLSEKYDDTESKSVKNKSVKSLLISSTKEEVDQSSWPDIMNCRYHGLYFNRALVSEQIEQQCVRYLSRYVGAETASSCTAWSHTAAPSSASKRRTARLRWAAKSPGRRLSHLARRRITFSSANLSQAKLSVVGGSATSGGSRQLMIDPRKTVAFNKRRSPRKSPWKKSPRKSPQKRIKTPKSSSKNHSFRSLPVPSDEDPLSTNSKVSTTKRALFQSPDHGRSTSSSSTSTSTTQPRNKSKRALFMSPTKRDVGDKKRKRADEEDSAPSKFPRSMSCDVQQSSGLLEAKGGIAMQRRNSEVIVRPCDGRGELSNLHKQKMLWAVSEALRAQQINMSHPQFRGFASILCKIIKQLVPDLMANGPRQPGSTSDRMLRIARQHSYAVTRGKTFEEIMQQVKESNMNKKNLKPPTGYVAPDSAKKVLQDKVMNIETNTKMKLETGCDEYNKLRNIRRQIVFDDNEISKSCNTNR